MKDQIQFAFFFQADFVSLESHGGLSTTFPFVCRHMYSLSLQTGMSKHFNYLHFKFSAILMGSTTGQQLGCLLKDVWIVIIIHLCKNLKYLGFLEYFSNV